MSWQFWLYLALACIFIEALTINLTTMWFALGGICTSIITCCLPGISLSIQMFLFVALSIIFVVCLKPLIKKMNYTCTNVNSLVGTIGVVGEDNRIQINGTDWAYISAAPLETGTKTVIHSVSGCSLNVKSLSEEQATICPDSTLLLKGLPYHYTWRSEDILAAGDDVTLIDVTNIHAPKKNEIHFIVQRKSTPSEEIISSKK